MAKFYTPPKICKGNGAMLKIPLDLSLPDIFYGTLINFVVTISFKCVFFVFFNLKRKYYAMNGFFSINKLATQTIDHRNGLVPNVDGIAL